MNINTGYWLCVFSICLIFCNQIEAQERRTVLLNTNQTETLDYKFENNLKQPIVVVNKGANLHLWLPMNKLDTNQIQYFNLNKKNSDKSIGQGKIIKGNTSLKIPLNIISEWNQKETVLEFMELVGRFTTPYTDTKVVFNNSSTTSADYSLNKQPKLVVDYEVAKETYGSEWSQLDGNAQHTNRIDWHHDDGDSGFEYKVKEIYKDTKKSIEYISIYKNKPIIFGKDENDKPYVAMLTGELGNKTSWRLPLNAFPDKQPVIMPDGKMLFVSGQNTLEILDLNEVKNIKSVPLSDIKISLPENESHTINSVADEMTLGYDGTIYMPITNNNGGKFGIVALSAYPSLKPRWFYNTTNPVGPVSLSENEKMAFFIETDKDSQKSRLMVLDNINGAVLARSKDILRSYSNDGNPYIPPVTLQTFDKDTTAVYVLDGYKASNKLYVFKAHYDQLSVQKEVTELEHFELIESKNSKNEGLSKPTVFNNEKIFFMRDNAVNHYTIKSNTTEEIISFNQDVSNKGDAQIFCNRESDGFDFLVLYGNKSYSFSSILGRALKLIDTNSGNLVKAAMLPNLGICTLDNNETLKYFYLEPFRKTTGVIDGIKHKHAYLKRQSDIIYIRPTIVTGNIQSIIVAKEIRIASGFTVRKGAELTFQIRK
jgi:hypothetical protein